MTLKSTTTVLPSQVREVLAQGKKITAIIHYAGKPHEFSETLSEFKERHEVREDFSQLEAMQNWAAETQTGIQFV